MIDWDLSSSHTRADEASGPSAGAGYPDDHKLGTDDPTLEVQVLPGSDLDKRWYVQLRLDWMKGEPLHWDLSKTHTVADVGHPFPADGSAEAYVPNITQLRIGLPQDQEFRIEDRAGEVRMTRSGDMIAKLAASFGEPTPQEAHRLALDLADQWRAPTAALDRP